MDACDPGIDVKNLKTLVKQNTGEDLSLTKGQICDIYSTIQDGKLPLPPLILSKDRSHLLDRKSPLTQSDFDKLFSASTKVSSIRRIAKKVGVARHADKKLTKAQLIGIIGRRLHATNIHEPIRLRQVQKKIVSKNVNSYNFNNNAGISSKPFNRENNLNNKGNVGNKIIKEESGNNNNTGVITSNNNGGILKNNKNESGGGLKIPGARNPLRNYNKRPSLFTAAKAVERGQDQSKRNLFEKMFGQERPISSSNSKAARESNKIKFYSNSSEDAYKKLRARGQINETYKDFRKRFLKEKEDFLKVNTNKNLKSNNGSKLLIKKAKVKFGERNIEENNNSNKPPTVPVVVPNKPPTVPVVVPNKPPNVPNKPPNVPNKPPNVPNKPPNVPNKPPNVPVVVPNKPPNVPVVVPNKPPNVPVVVPNKPPNTNNKNQNKLASYLNQKNLNKYINNNTKVNAFKRLNKGTLVNTIIKDIGDKITAKKLNNNKKEKEEKEQEELKKGKNVLIKNIKSLGINANTNNVKQVLNKYNTFGNLNTAKKELQSISNAKHQVNVQNLIKNTNVNHINNPKVQKIIKNFENKKRVGVFGTGGVYKKNKARTNINKEIEKIVKNTQNKQNVENEKKQKLENNKTKLTAFLGNKGRSENNVTNFLQKLENGVSLEKIEQTVLQNQRMINSETLKIGRSENQEVMKIIKHYVNQKKEGLLGRGELLYKNKQSVIDKIAELNQKRSNNKETKETQKAENIKKLEVKINSYKNSYNNLNKSTLNNVLTSFNNGTITYDAANKKLNKIVKNKSNENQKQKNNTNKKEQNKTNLNAYLNNKGVTNKQEYINRLNKGNKINKIKKNINNKVLSNTKSENVKKLRENYPNNTNAQKIINTFEKGGFFAPKTVNNTKSKISEMIEKRLENKEKKEDNKTNLNSYLNNKGITNKQEYINRLNKGNKINKIKKNINNKVLSNTKIENVKKLRENYPNNANAQKIINKFAKGGFMAPKTVNNTKSKISEMIEKRLEKDEKKKNKELKKNKENNEWKNKPAIPSLSRSNKIMNSKINVPNTNKQKEHMKRVYELKKFRNNELKLKDRESGNVITRFIANPGSNFNNAKSKIKNIANSLKVNNNKAKKQAEEAEAKREEQKKLNAKKAENNAKKAENNAKKAEEAKREEQKKLNAKKAENNAKKAENNAKKAEEAKREEKTKKRQGRLNNIREKEINGENVNNKKLKALKVRIDKFVPDGWLGGRRKEFLARAKRNGVTSVHNNLNKRLKLTKQVEKSEHANKSKLLNSIHDPKFAINTLKNKISKNSDIIKMYKNSVKKVESMKDLLPIYKSTFTRQLKNSMKMPDPKQYMNSILINANKKRNPNKPPPPQKENKNVMNRERKRVQAKLIKTITNKPPSPPKNKKANLKKLVNNTMKGRAAKNVNRLKKNINEGISEMTVKTRLAKLNKQTKYQK
jgi:hypothetical protein